MGELSDFSFEVERGRGNRFSPSTRNAGKLLWVKAVVKLVPLLSVYPLYAAPFPPFPLNASYERSRSNMGEIAVGLELENVPGVFLIPLLPGAPVRNADRLIERWLILLFILVVKLEIADLADSERLDSLRPSPLKVFSSAVAETPGGRR